MKNLMILSALVAVLALGGTAVNADINTDVSRQSQQDILAYMPNPGGAVVGGTCGTTCGMPVASCCTMPCVQTCCPTMYGLFDTPSCCKPKAPACGPCAA